MKKPKESFRDFKASLRKLGVIPQHSLDDTSLPLYDIYEDTFEVVRANTKELRKQRIACAIRCIASSRLTRINR